jgi:BRCT domain type II-containing protein
MMFEPLLALVAMVLHNPGNLLPDLEGVQESQVKTAQITEADTFADVVVTLEGDYTTAPAIAVAAILTTKSAGSASTEVESAIVTAWTADSVTVRVTLDAAPGVGETTDIRCSLIAAGAGPGS